MLIFKYSERAEVKKVVDDLGGILELPFVSEDDKRMKCLLKRAIIAVECENSLWIARKMPDYNADLRPQKRLDGRLGLKKNAVLPTVIIKDEDRLPLLSWQKSIGIPIHIWHAFFDEAYGLSIDEAERLISEGFIQETTQVFQAPGGAVTKKGIFKFYHHYAYPLAITVSEPSLEAMHITDANGHIMPYVRFSGGKSALSEAAITMLSSETVR